MRRIPYILCILLLILINTSCNEDNFLNEEPQDFYTTGNAYQKPKDINTAVNHLYAELRQDFFTYWTPDHGVYRWVATDMAWDAIAVTHRFNLYDKVIPESNITEYVWNHNYELIKNANTVISRIKDVKFNSESESKKLEAQAKFFRAWAYRYLAIMYGDVPLLLKELKGPKRDFKRAPVDSVWDQAIRDAKYAIENLPTISERNADGRLSKAAARQLLTQIYMATKDYNKAVNQASAIIDDPNFSLMTQRFGSQVNEPGDVYSDLFNRGDQNRSSGNTESIWVSQYGYQTAGGGEGNHMLWILIPKYWSLKDQNGTNLFTSALSRYGGEGQGWMSSTSYMDTLIWKRSGWNSDMRNSKYNILHDVVANNKKSTLYGKKIIKNGALKYNINLLRRPWHAIYLKVAPVGNFPERFITNPQNGEITSGDYTFRDTYIYRLAQTYLLRAEAYLRLGKNSLAANDVNTVRKRAHAKLVAPGKIDVNYILDERARELAWEGTSFRRLTLMRMDRLVDRTQKYNPVSASSIKDFNKLMPIPSQEIERNTARKLEQNPGY